jgi:drug/metabolite transporter (DMT)-like permease
VRSSRRARRPAEPPPPLLNAQAGLLALGSALVWGVSDFAGGFLTRRLPTLTVTLVSQLAGFAALLAVFFAEGGAVERRSLLIGLLAGVGGGAGLAAFYKALALGSMSIVSPLAACGELIPFGVSIATGERPAPLAIGGAALAFAGAVAVSVPEHRAPEPARAQAVVLATFSAVALGTFTYFLGLGSREGSPLSTLLGARLGSLLVLSALALVAGERPRLAARAALAVAAVGLCDMAANALFALSSTHGLLALVSVLGSLYPLVTVLLAYVLLGERLGRLQRTAVLVALIGVCALAGS